jgi:hypothetical protein
MLAVLLLTLLPQRSLVSSAVVGLSVRSAEEQLRCYDTVESLSRELRSEVRPGPREDDELDSEARKLRQNYMPYTNKYCKERDGRTLEIRPDGCLLEPFDPVQFLAKFRGRRLIIWGDSTQRQFFTYLSARLEEFASSKANISKKTHYATVGRGCKLSSVADRHTGLQLTEPCFTVRLNHDFPSRR